MDEESIASETRSKLEDDMDALFKHSFVGARNDLAARLKRSGRAEKSGEMNLQRTFRGREETHAGTRSR